MRPRREPDSRALCAALHVTQACTTGLVRRLTFWREWPSAFPQELFHFVDCVLNDAEPLGTYVLRTGAR